MNSSPAPVRIRRPGEPVSVTERSTLRMILNIVLGLLVLVNAYLAYGYVTVQRKAEEARLAELDSLKAKPIQVNVLNGTTHAGIAAKCTDYLRRHGFDVVEMKNFPFNGIPRTIIVDRVGDPKAALRTAQAVGLDESSVIQQVNPNLFVDVTIILGNDYSNLVPFSQ